MCVFNVITLIHRWFQLLASGLLQVLTSDDNLDLEYVWVFVSCSILYAVCETLPYLATSNFPRIDHFVHWILLFTISHANK